MHPSLLGFVPQPNLRGLCEHHHDADLERHVDYIHANPIKHGLVSRVADWPYSSFDRYVADGLLPVDWLREVRDVGGYGE